VKKSASRFFFVTRNAYIYTVIKDKDYD
jgi:hypothetical protein